jgi:SAM-dependent methyltransferase
MLLDAIASPGSRPSLLDVGGRKSHYTIGVPAGITISDLPRETRLQEQLNLGIDRRIIAQTGRRRTNVRAILLDDMTRSSLPDACFDCVVAVEVLEHVERDDRFVAQVRRVLKPGGVFLMTTPNGDFVKNTNPDHIRHYTRDQLVALLSTEFTSVDVIYAIRGGYFRKLGLRSWSARHPLRTALSMAGNLVNAVQSSSKKLDRQSQGTRHLIALARKPH